jgi:DNA-binding response OmpR family regulator
LTQESGIRPRTDSSEATSAGAASASFAPFAASTRSRTVDHFGPVVLVEDHDDTREMLSLHLQSLGYEVHTAADGEQALRLIEQLKPSAVIADLNLPGHDGYEVARFARCTREDVRLIALTGLSARKAWTASMEAGFDFFLTKPVDAASLGPYLRNPLYQERPAYPARRR